MTSTSPDANSSSRNVDNISSRTSTLAAARLHVQRSGAMGGGMDKWLQRMFLAHCTLVEVLNLSEWTRTDIHYNVWDPFVSTCKTMPEKCSTRLMTNLCLAEFSSRSRQTYRVLVGLWNKETKTRLGFSILSEADRRGRGVQRGRETTG